MPSCSKWILTILLTSACALGGDDRVCVTEVRVSGQTAEALASSEPAMGKTPAMDELRKTAFVRLESKRLVLSTPAPGDLPLLVPIFNDFLSVRYTWFWENETYWNPERMAEKFDAFAKDQLEGKRHDFVIRLKQEPHALIGRCAFFQTNTPGVWEYGITIFRSYWGNHLAREVMAATLEYAFSNLGATRVWFRTEPENEQMLRQYPHFGIEKAPDTEEQLPTAGKDHEYLTFKIDAVDWN